jgi:hypothetical protein
MSYAEWFFRALGLWGLLQLLVGVGIFVWAIYQAIRSSEIRLLGMHGAVLLVPLLIGLILGAIDCLSLIELIGLLDRPLTPLEILHDMLLTVGRKLLDALIVTIPAALVLAIAWLFPIRRRLK